MPGASPFSAFDAEMLAALPVLRRYARSLSQSDADGEDLFQDCCEKAVANRRQWRGTNLRGWLFAIMTNLSRTRFRNAPVERRFVDLDHAAGVETETTIADPIAQDHLMAALGALPPDFRAVLMLVAVEGYAYQEVAEILSIPIGTVMSRLSRARRQIAENLRGANVVTHRRRN